VITETGNAVDSQFGAANPSVDVSGLVIEAGDVVVATVCVNAGGAAITDQNGGDAFTEDFQETDPLGNTTAWFSRVAGASEPSTYTWSHSGGSTHWSIIVRVLKGVDTTDIWDVAPSAGTRNDGSGATITAPTMTVATDGAMGILWASLDSSSTAWSGPTNGYHDQVETPNGGFEQGSYIRLWQAGATGTSSASIVPSDAWVAHQVALKPANGFLSGYGRRQRIAIDADSYVAGDVEVPVAIHIPASNTDFWANDNGQGVYARFTLADGTTPLPFEVESYDGAGEDAWFHVKVPLAADIDTYIYLYYDADTPTDGADVANTWDATFLNVYHLNEDLHGGTELTDSKGSNDLTANGSPTTNIAVAVDKGADLAAASDEHYSTGPITGETAAILCEAWVQFDSLTGTQGIVAQYDGGGDRNWLLYKQTGGDIVFRMYDTADTARDSGAFTPSTGVLYHIAGVYEADGPELYVNGVKQGSGATESGGLRGDTCTQRVGAFNATNTLDGKIDEVTISDGVRTEDWIIARYRAGLGAWLSFGSEETPPVAGADITRGAQYTVLTSSSVTPGAQYAVKAPAALTLGAQYVVTGQGTDIQKGAQYTVKAPAEATLGAQYAVGLGATDLQSPTQYAVKAAAAITLGAQYAVVAPAGTITLTEPTERSIVQRVGAAGSLALSGTYTGSPTAIEARVVLHGTSTEVVTWTTVDASPSGGTWSGTLAGVPQGGWYNVQVRFSNEVGTTDNGTNRVGVGVLIGCIGQSNISHWFETGYGSDTAGDLISYYNDTGWAQVPDTWGPACVFGNGISDVLGIPVGLIDYGVGGSALDLAAGGPGGGQWLDTAQNANYDEFTDGVTAVGGNLEMVVWDQGERDAGDSISYATYLADLDTFFARIRSDIRADLPIIMSPLRRVTDTGHTESDAVWQGIMDAQIERVRIDPLTFLGATEKDLPLRGDGLHLSDAGYVTQTERLARACLAVMGEAGFYRGPEPVSYTISGSTVDVRLRHRGTTDIVPDLGTDFTGWEVLDDGTPVTINSATRLDYRTIRLALASSPTGTVTVRHLYGKAPTVTNVAMSAGTVQLPVEVNSAIPEARTITLTLVDRTGSARASLTGLYWALFDLNQPDAFAAPVHQGSGETTDGSGVFSVQIPETDVPAGGDAWLVISDSDGTAGQNPTSIAFSAPVAV
jgi:hypothetical protein